MKRHWLIPTGVVIAILFFGVIGILIPAGMFKNIVPHYSGSITEVDLPLAGPEDFTLDRDAGLAFISADDRRSNLRGNPVPGAILLIDLNQPGAIRNITPPLPDFHPHGISLWRAASGDLFLFAVNHQKQYSHHTVEKFVWRNDSLIHLESFLDPDLMTSPNDVVAVGERSFYVTNDHGYGEKGLARTLEEYLQRSISYVNYFDGQAFRKVASGIAYANGINVSNDQQKIYVAATTGRNVLIYQRLTTGDLVLEKDIPTQTGVDNIEVDEHGVLWIGCHPQLLKFAAHAADSTKISPSQVIKINNGADDSYQVTEVFLNDGSGYSGSSVAVPYQNRLMIGSVFEKSILIGTN